MFDKIGHIKNPLTVIAMFAAIAEVSGTIILPMIPEEVQKIYVWFLMLFPVLLVLLFYGTLWKDHTVFYAPSDFANEQAFAQLALRKSSRANIEEKFEEEAASAAEASDAVDLSEPYVNAEAPAETCAGEHPKAQGAPDAASESTGARKNVIRREYYRKKVKAAEVCAIQKLSEDLGTEFLMNVESPLIPGFVFDAVSADKRLPAVIEVKYCSGNTYRPNLDSFEAVSHFYSKLSGFTRPRFRFYFVLVFNEKNRDHAYKLVETIKDASESWSFKTHVILMNEDELKGQSWDQITCA